MDSVRIQCSEGGYEGNYIDVVPRWTRGDTKRLDAATDESYFELLREKLTGLHLEIYATDGQIVGTIDDPADLSIESFDELDEVVAAWIGAALWTYVGNRRRLGNASALVLSNTSDKPAPTKTEAS